MPMSTWAITSLVHKIVSPLGPQILLPLFFRPASGPTLRLQVGHHRLLKVVKACRVHVGRVATVLIGADNPDCLSTSQIFLSDHDVFGVAAVVVEAALGSTAGPGAVESVEFWCGHVSSRL